MKNGSIKITLIAGALMLAALSFAQGGGGQGGQRQGGGGFGQGRMGGGGSDTGLLSSPDVQKELKVTTEQMASITKIQEEARTERQNMMQNGGGGGDRTEMMKMMQDMQKKTDAKIAGVLNADQNKRLKQIGIQNAGGRALYREDVQKDLALTAVQKKSLVDLQTKQQEAMRAMFQDMQDMTQEERTAAMAKNNKAAGDEALAILTAEQKTAFEALKGPKFEGKIVQGGRGGQGGGGRGGNGGGGTGGTGGGTGSGRGGGSTGGGTGGGL